LITLDNVIHDQMLRHASFIHHSYYTYPDSLLRGLTLDVINFNIV